ncbi:hypothetical protein PTSG_03615 [Salpingoeca rosetta]|uniref:Nuclear RNA export factor 1 n=1 Tax=Salpingoeca rosetta (strain ATCC 50818 / BSB-021) TaxID=946362 RepID=F2U637_SALR5|nr:uncharacterized protein PTSG_03615 [Salpingoeca rosetta]EGD82978.1 hypothetical protein PTSG_03615 [Salpingoeca rosetta]|eukprot:XP_004995342.1 hypothetical protein PTSG_03615 [Salpingoeca rosetta]
MSRAFQAALGGVARQPPVMQRQQPQGGSLGMFSTANSMSTPYTTPVTASRQAAVAHSRPPKGESMSGFIMPSGARKKKGRKGKQAMDRDGDVVMSTAARTRTNQKGGRQGKKGSKKKKGKGSKSSSKRTAMLKSSVAAMRGRIRYNVQVLNPSKLPAETIEQFLRANCAESFHVIKCRETKNSVIFTLPSVNERAVNTFKRLNSRAMLNDQPISINVKEVEVKGSKASSFELPPELLSPRYDPASKHLNLSNFVNDPSMSAFMPADGLNSFDLANAIIDVIKANCADVVTLDLSENNIRSFESWKRLGNVAKKLKNLSLATNDIKDLSALSDLRSCRGIEVLLLLNNPCVVKYSTSRERYEKALRRYFRKLTEVDQLPVTHTSASKDAPKQSLPQQVLLAPHENNTGPPELVAGCREFLAKFFSIFDSKRDQLMHAYKEDATFQLHVPSIGHGKTSLRPYAPPKKKGRSVHTKKQGPIDIVSLLKRFPKSTHQNAAEVAVCVREATGADIKCIVSGRLQEQARDCVLQRVFRREFHLVPAEETSPAALSGWPCVIQSETLTLAHDTVPSGASAPPNSPSAPAAPAAPAAAVPDVAQKQAMVQQLAADTGMNFAFSEECLAGNNWIYDAAVANFRELQASNSLPPEAFQQ